MPRNFRSTSRQNTVEHVGLNLEKMLLVAAHLGQQPPVVGA